MKFRRLLIALFAVAVLLVSASFAASIQVDGVVKDYDTMTVRYRTYIVGDALKEYGFSVAKENDQITITNGKDKMVLVENKNELTVNGTKMTFDGRPFVKDGKVYIPLRLVFETIGYEVGYDYANKMPYLNKENPIAFPLTIKDKDPKTGVEMTYTFQKPVKAIVSLAPSVTETLFAIGAGDMVKGRTDYCLFPEEVSKIASVGKMQGADFEKIIEINPGLVIAATHVDTKVMDQLKKTEIQVLTQKTPETLEQIYEFIANAGALTDRQFTARALISTMKAKVENVKEVVDRIPADKRVDVYFAVGAGEYGEYTSGKNTFGDEVLATAGLVNVANDVEGWSYTLEKLIDKNPSVIIGGKFVLGAIKASEAHKGLTGKHLEIDDSVFTVPGPRVVDYSIKTLVKELYPNLFKYINF